MTSALMTCVHAGRRKKKTNTTGTGIHRTGRTEGKGGGGGQKKKKKKAHNAPLRAHSTEQAGSGRTGRSNRCTGQEKGATGK